MLEKLTVFTLSSAMARHAAARHNVIAQNVAHADTPGYRARDVEDFSAVVNEGFTARRTREGHLGWGSTPDRPEPFEIEMADSPNGNSVNLADQTRRAVEARQSHALATAVYSKAVDLLRIGLGRTS